MSEWMVGVDLGATKIALGLVNPQDQIVARRRIPTNVSDGPHSAVERMAQCVAELEAEIPTGERVAALGICSPGPIDHITGLLIDPPNLPTFHHTPLRQMLENWLNIPVGLEHDANAAALGEFYYGAGRDVSSMVYVIVGTGVGAAIIVDGQIMRGVGDSAGEVGHITLDRDGDLCACGSRGCVETYMSGPWLSRRYLRALEPEAGREEITGAEVSDLAVKGDPLAIRIMTEAGEALGVAVASMAMILDIELYIIGGGVVKAGDVFLDPARQIVPRYSYKSVGPRVQIVPGALGDDGPILGCSWLARQLSKDAQQTIPIPASDQLSTIPTELDENDVTGIIFDIQRYSVHDGPGLRTNVFFKGCPLRCGWCANPESHHMKPEIAVFDSRCIACDQFSPDCPALWTAQNGDQAKSGDYAERIAQCPVEAVRVIGQTRTAGSIMDEVCRDKPFYRDGGGLTLTGGEPLLQPRFAEALLKLAKAEGISTAVETTGYVAWTVIEQVLPYIDDILFDLKHIDSAMHRTHTGVGNELILENLEKLSALKAPLTIRVPLIPGFNATAESIQAMGEYVSTALNGAIREMDLLPYHALGSPKYRALRRDYPWEGYSRLSQKEVETLADILRSSGFRVGIGG